MESEGSMSDDRRIWWGSVLGEEDGGGVESGDVDAGDVDVGDVDVGSDGIVEINIE